MPLHHKILTLPSLQNASMLGLVISRTYDGQSTLALPQPPKYSILLLSPLPLLPLH